MRNKQKHINVTVANQFTVHKHATKKFFLKRVKHQQAVFYPHRFTVNKKRGALLFNEERPIFKEQL
jgi:hypothetical protein